MGWKILTVIFSGVKLHVWTVLGEESVHISEVSLFQGLNCMQELLLGKEKVSLLERCLHFRGVLSVLWLHSFYIVLQSCKSLIIRWFCFNLSQLVWLQSRGRGDNIQVSFIISNHFLSYCHTPFNSLSLSLCIRNGSKLAGAYTESETRKATIKLLR